jgi:CelD/BcsL family acetyltransferase involved in cellulose biosynthesis
LKGSSVERPAREVSVEWYDEPLPVWLDQALVDLRANLYSTMPYIRIDNPGVEPRAFVMRSRGAPVQIIVFGSDGRRVNVLNSGNRLSAEDIALFTREIFARYPRVSAIVFPPSHAEIGGLSYPHQFGVMKEDIVVTLSDTVDAYRMRLGGETRRHLKRRLEQLRREYPSNAFEVRRGADVPEAWIGEIVRLNHARMAAQSKTSGLDDENERRMQELMDPFGVVGVVTIDGEVAAGGIGFRVGPNFFLLVIAHDPRYDPVSLGRLCVYFMICDAIESEAREFHFLWGEHSYKYSFLGENRDLMLANVYRSRRHILLHTHAFLSTAVQLERRRLKPWLGPLRRRLQRPFSRKH